MFEHMMSLAKSNAPKRFPRTILISINPDLKSDFGHFLNYEKRLNEACFDAGITHHCLSALNFKNELPFITGIFVSDSGHYSLLRNSAKGCEEAISKEFHQIITSWMESYEIFRKFEKVVVFIYMSSTRAASWLTTLAWPDNVQVVANSFWDFLVAPPTAGDADLARIKIQDKVTLTAMSTSHRLQMHSETGLMFPAIPNPPPLISDSGFFEVLTKSFATKVAFSHRKTRILLPGLMSEGKGAQITERFIENSDRFFPECEVIVRDRNRKLNDFFGGQLPSNVQLLTGDFSDNEIIDLFFRADIAVLPYSASVFRVRTSGALVDCLMSGTIPVVLPETWLSKMCRTYEFGIICESESLQDVLGATRHALLNKHSERQRMLSGAVSYMTDNSWSKFLELIQGCHPQRAMESLPVSAFDFPSDKSLPSGLNDAKLELVRLSGMLLLNGFDENSGDLPRYKDLLRVAELDDDTRAYFQNLLEFMSRKVFS